MYFQNVFALGVFYFGTQRVKIFAVPRKQMQNMTINWVDRGVVGTRKLNLICNIVANSKLRARKGHLPIL